MSHYIEELKINDLFNIKEVTIKPSQKFNYSFAITGRNGSGKTTLLNEILKNINMCYSGRIFEVESLKVSLKQNKTNLAEAKKVKNVAHIKVYNDQILVCEERLKSYLDIRRVSVKFGSVSELKKNMDNGNFSFVFLEARRNANFIVPSNIGKSLFSIKEQPTQVTSQTFISHLVNYKSQGAFALQDKDIQASRENSLWFEGLEKHLKSIYSDKDLSLDFDRNTLNFSIKLSDGKSFYLNELSDGYGSILEIMASIMTRLNDGGRMGYNKPGIVIIDEIETHLHVQLQRKILPFLISVFPKIQFIFTTHSPFVLSSVEDLNIFDLESSTFDGDISKWSIPQIIESYFDVDLYSLSLQERLNKLVKLSSENRTSEEDIEFKNDLIYLNNLDSEKDQNIDMVKQMVRVNILRQESLKRKKRDSRDMVSKPINNSVKIKLSNDKKSKRSDTLADVKDELLENTSIDTNEEEA
ncbi:hypothetical protein A9Q84_00160 [Halobacteriovorax marinus]|uniref:AAA+ ATPase domain-containing protein n=1 Tax=Halobacteriovorax marinus TaxID=97084 RepID=A0A1Y5FD24_9BACT|nr:hypothetical protein A9Q84_00160 [Halobacteriovorax marinus]